VHIVHACKTDPGDGFAGSTDPDARAKAGQAMLRTAVGQVHAIAPTLAVSTACVRGFASPTLIQVSHKAAMVVMGAVGHGIISRASIGPTTLQVAMNAHCPVVVIGHEGRTSASAHGRVVVGVDGSADSLGALGEAFDRAALRGAKLQVVHAWQPRKAGNGVTTAVAGWPTHESDLEEAVEATITAHTAAHPDVAVAHDIVKGDPVRALGEHSQDADLVIVGRRGLGGFPGLRIGSVPVRLMGRTACPLVIAPLAA
jgi:nucleotide-binding universal stress UspA family protein